MAGLVPAIYRGVSQAWCGPVEVAHRSGRVKAGAARPRTARGCGLDAACPMSRWLGMRSARCAERGVRRPVVGAAGPGLAVAGDGVGGNQDFAHNGGEGDLAGSAVAGDEAVVEILEGRGVADGG